MPRDIKDILSPRDKSILDAKTNSTWVPPEPAELILPYIAPEQEPEPGSIDYRRKKAKEVYDGYGKIIEECKKLRVKINERCKNVDIDLDKDQHLTVMKAVRRVFGTDGTKITFEMYKKCIEELSKSSNKNAPKPKE